MNNKINDFTQEKYNYKRLIIEIALIFALIFADLISKTLVFSFLETQPNEKYVVLEGIWTFILSKNYGASFGAFDGNTIFLLIITITMTALLTAILFYFKKTPRLFRLGLVMIIGGGIGNLYDRMLFGYVRDFIDYTFLKTFFGIDFAIGNIADVYVCVGVLLLLVYIIFEYEEKDFYTAKTLKKLIALEEKKKLEEEKTVNVVNKTDCVDQFDVANNKGTNVLNNSADSASKDEIKTT